MRGQGPLTSAAGSDVPDWQDPGAYAALLALERAGFAWEWLRRQRAYREAALAAIAQGGVHDGAAEERALPWGLHRFEDPRLPAPYARPIWTASAHAWVLGAVAERSTDGADSFLLESVGTLARIAISKGAQHLLLSDGYRSIRLDVSGAPLTRSPVRLSFELAGLRSLERPLLIIRRLRSLALCHRLAISLHPPVHRAQRLVNLLRAFDALQAGASQADIASEMLSDKLERRRWRVRSPSLRSRAQRLARAARHMAGGQFWNLLD